MVTFSFTFQKKKNAHSKSSTSISSSNNKRQPASTMNTVGKITSRVSCSKRADKRRYLTWNEQEWIQSHKVQNRSNLHAVMCFLEFTILIGIVSLLSHILKKELNLLQKKNPHGLLYFIAFKMSN